MPICRFRRLQDRWPLDGEDERYEVACIVQRLKEDKYRAAERAEGLVKKAGEAERLAKREAEDRARLGAWVAQAGRAITGWSRAALAPRRCVLSRNAGSALIGAVPSDTELETLLAAGPPATCTTAGVYDRCGGSAPPSVEEIDGQRLFSGFEVFGDGGGGEGWAGDIKGAAKLFDKLGRPDGFDAMFTFRFS